MIQHVQRNEPIRASKINEIIDGQDIASSTLDVSKTDSGTLINLPSKFRIGGQTLDKLFQCGPTKLSGYPYTAVNMGSRLGDCLAGVVVHEGGGESSPVSAAVVYRNSPHSPQQNHLSGYMLSAEQFGNDARIGSTGWLSTLMEWPHDGFCRDITLGVWKAKGGRYMAFTNCSSLEDAREELAVQLSGAGATEDELSGMQLEHARTLMRAVPLEVETESAPVEYMSKPLGRNDGEVHIWPGSDQSGVEWKADLVCWQKDEEQGQSNWCWKVWLGPDSEWNDELELVTAQCQGGDEFALSATKLSALSALDSAEGPGVMASPFGGYDIYFDRFQAGGDEPVTPSPAYLVLKYDKDYAYVQGSFANTPDPGHLSSDGILLRNTFVALAGQFMPLSPQVGSKAPESLIARGTWGFLDRSPLKPDSYLPDVPHKTAKSLEWKTPRSDQEGPVDSHALQLYGFSQNGGVSSVLSTDEYVIRRRDDDGNKWIEYAPLSAMDVPPDAEISDAQQSSIAWLSGDYGKVLELYNFHEEPLSDIGVMIDALSGEFRVGGTREWFVIKDDDHVDYRTLNISVDLSDSVLSVVSSETSTILSVLSTEVSTVVSTIVSVQVPPIVSSIISGLSGCSCDMSAILTSGTEIAKWTKDGENWTSIYCLSGGGGGDCSCELEQVLTSGTEIARWSKDGGGNWTSIYAPSGGGDCSASISGNVPGSTGTGPEVQIVAGLSCRLSAWSEAGRLSVAVYYL